LARKPIKRWLRLVAVAVVFHQEFLGVVKAVGAGLAVVKMGRRDPFGGAVFAFSGRPALFG
jgi:hypothetical protein